MSNGKRYKRTNLLKLPDGYKPEDIDRPSRNIIKKATSEFKQAQQNKRDSIDLNNIISDNNIISKRKIIPRQLFQP